MDRLAEALFKIHHSVDPIAELQQRIEQLENRLASQEEKIGRLLLTPKIVSHINHRPSAGDIRTLICREYRMTIPEFDSSMRSKALVICRRRAFYLAARHTGLALTVIGRVYNRDRTSIMYQYKCVAKIRARDPNEDTELSRLEKLLGV